MNIKAHVCLSLALLAALPTPTATMQPRQASRTRTALKWCAIAAAGTFAIWGAVKLRHWLKNVRNNPEIDVAEVNQIAQAPEQHRNPHTPQEAEQALLWGAGYCNVGIVRNALRTPGINIDARNTGGLAPTTALHRIASYPAANDQIANQSYTITRLLLGAGANANLPIDNQSGLSALMLATMASNSGVARALLAHPAIDVNAVDTSGLTAFQQSLLRPEQTNDLQQTRILLVNDDRTNIVLNAQAENALYHYNFERVLQTARELLNHPGITPAGRARLAESLAQAHGQ